MPLKPQTIRIDAATVCQLKCPSCPTAGGEIGASIGSGFLRFQNFKELLDKNDFVKRIELTNWGEIFLNPDLLSILQYAHEKGIHLLAVNGVNLNNIKPEVIEGLVKYGFRAITVSIDGATQEVYEQYRVNGNLNTVLNHIRQINEYKRQYNSVLPKLFWQFVVFGHNEHEVEQARAMAEGLDMTFQPKLNWEDLYNRPFSPIKDKDFVRSVLGAADREEFQIKNQRHFCSVVCQELWTSPQINYDGEVLGCPVNYWQSFGNAFKEDLVGIVNGERMNYAREMIRGAAPERDDIPCSSCKIYKQMKTHSTWVTVPAQIIEEQKMQERQRAQAEMLKSIMQAKGFGTI